MPLVLPYFDVGRSRNDPANIPPQTRFSSYRSTVRPPFLILLESGVSSRHCRLAPIGCSSKFHS
ncbi:hypothetical protein PanWU01x14_081570, partial [Parasponia andersonii]